MKLPRRSLLERTLALFAVPVVGPLARALVGEARAQTLSPRRRFIVYSHANGLQLAKVRETTWDPAGGFRFAGCLAPLARHARDLTVLEQFFCTNGAYLHGNLSAAYTCSSRGTIRDSGSGAATRLAGGASIDQVIAAEISRGSRFPSLVMGMPFSVSGGNCSYGALMATGDNKPVYPDVDPAKVYARLFGVTGAVNGAELLTRLKARRSQLDHLLAEIKELEATLPARERQKLQQYLESLSALEREIATQAATPQGECRAAAPSPGPARVGSNDPRLWKTFLDLAIAALRCNQTQQISLVHTYGCVHLSYNFDGVSKNHHETVCHQEETGPFLTRILAWHAEQVAYLYDQLKQIPEGGGTMADSTLLMWMSDGGGRHHNGTRMHPVVLLGRAGGRWRAGQYRTWAQNQVSLARVHCTVANAMGLPLKTFGDGRDPCEGPLGELLS